MYSIFFQAFNKDILFVDLFIKIKTSLVLYA